MLQFEETNTFRRTRQHLAKLSKKKLVEIERIIDVI